MKSLTEKQAQFVVHKAAGMSNRESAVAAGYAPGAADVQAAKLLRIPAIRAAIKKAAPKAKPKAPESEASIDTGMGPDGRAMPKDHYGDPIDFLTDLMNHRSVPLAMRADAAKQLLPYKHAKLGEKGSKEKTKERAEGVTRGRFSPKAPPPSGGKAALTVVK